jgi:hypothetical protein
VSPAAYDSIVWNCEIATPGDPVNPHVEARRIQVGG